MNTYCNDMDRYAARLGKGGKVMYAIIKSGGKQYKVEPGMVIKVEKLDAKVDAEVSFEALMTSDGKTVAVGSPILTDVVVKGVVIAHDKAKKIIVFKYKPKEDYRKKQGHRQPYTKVEITQVGAEIVERKVKAAAVKKADTAEKAVKPAVKAPAKPAAKAAAKPAAKPAAKATAAKPAAKPAAKKTTAAKPAAKKTTTAKPAVKKETKSADTKAE